MSVGLSGTAHREPPPLKLIRVLWRMRGATRVAAAGLFEHPLEHTRELRVYFEPLESDQLLHSEVARIDFGPLETKAEELRVLGWRPLPIQAA
jgi:hypothetical protein